jgi:predicted phosphodiesterase
MELQRYTRLLMMGAMAVAVGILLACNATPATAPAMPPNQPSRPPATREILLATDTAVPTPTPPPTATPIVVGSVSTNVSYTLPLTVQHVTDTSATLFCELSAPVAGVLLYEPLEGDVRTQQQEALAPGQTRQQITLAGLLPGIKYQAEIGIPGTDGATLEQPGFMEQTWGPISFRTASGQEPLRIGVLGDSGFGQQATYDLAARMASANLDFVIHTGDVVYNIEENADAYEAYALKYYLPLAPILHQMPVYLVVGNHEVEQPAMFQGKPFYYQAFPAFTDPRFPAPGTGGSNQWYAFAYDDVQFVMLDTQTFFNEQGRAEQTAWLSERLADTRFAYSIPVFHVPPFTSGLHPSDGLPVRSEWDPLFEAANVPLVLSGHDHNYQRLEANGITYIVSGGGSATLYNEGAAAPEGKVFVRKTHFVLMEIYKDRIDLQAIALDGTVIDKVTIPITW